jgi:hypothetical protein
LNLHSRFARFVSALKIPFPGNGDFGSKRRSSNAGSSQAAGAVAALLRRFALIHINVLSTALNEIQGGLMGRSAVPPG